MSARRKRKRRRRYGIPRGQYTDGMEVVRDVQGVLRESPDLLLPMYGHLMRAWAGQWLYYQAPAGEVRAEEIGDPVGDIRDIVSGEIRAVQEVDADRPVLGGDHIAGRDGDYLVVDISSLDSEPHTISMSVEPHAAGDNERAYGTDSATDTNVRSAVTDNWALRNTESDDIRTGDNSVGLRGTLTGVHDQPAILRHRDDETSGDVGEPSIGESLGIFARSDGTSPLDADVRWWAYWGRAVDLETRRALEARA